MLPSFASMRDENAPPSRKSTVAKVVCQSSEAEFHCLMSSGVVYAYQTTSIGAATVVSTVIFSVDISTCFLLLIVSRLRTFDCGHGQNSSLSTKRSQEGPPRLAARGSDSAIHHGVDPMPPAMRPKTS